MDNWYAFIYVDYKKLLNFISICTRFLTQLRVAISLKLRLKVSKDKDENKP